MILSGFFAFLLPLFARFLPAPQVIFDLLFGVKPAPERAHPRTPARSACLGPILNAPRPYAHAHTLTRSRTRILFIYILYIYSFLARMRTPPRLYAHTCTPPRSPAPLRTRFYLFPFLYDLFSFLSPLFMIYFPFFSSLYDLFIKLYIYIPFFYDLFIMLYVL